MDTQARPHGALVALLCTLLLTFSSPSLGAQTRVQASNNLQDISREASQRQLPIILMITASYCGFCYKLEKQFIQPLLADPAYARKFLIRKLVVDSTTLIDDFNGSPILPFDVAERYGVDIAPSLVFLSCEGEVLAEKLIGSGSEYGYKKKLMARIDTAYSKRECTR